MRGVRALVRAVPHLLRRGDGPITAPQLGGVYRYCTHQPQAVHISGLQYNIVQYLGWRQQSSPPWRAPLGLRFRVS